MPRNAIRWTGPDVVTPPTERLSDSDIRAMARLTQSEGTTEPRRVKSGDDTLLALLRDGVTAQYEAVLNRAIYPQRRRVTAYLPEDAWLDYVLLEPHTNLTITAGESLGSLVAVDAARYTADGEAVRFDPVLEGRRVRFEYDAGWNALPADMRNALLATITNEFERRNEEQSKTKRRSLMRMSCAPEAMRYRVHTTPTPLVPVA